MPMPTSRRRHTITESDEIARALEDAARAWPDEPSASARLVRLIGEGRRAVHRHEADELARRHKAIEDTSGALTGVYPEGHLARVRDDWPE